MLMSFEEECPEAEGCGEPDGHEANGWLPCGWAIAHKDEADDAGVEEEGDGSGEHGAGFGGGVGTSVAGNGEAEGGERDGGRGSEESGESFWTEDVTEDGEEANHGSSDEEAKEEVTLVRPLSGLS